MASQVKFQQSENIRVTQSGGGGPPPSGVARSGAAPPPAPPHREDLAHEIGDALTKGAGPGGYLAVSPIPVTKHRQKK